MDMTPEELKASVAGGARKAFKTPEDEKKTEASPPKSVAEALQMSDPEKAKRDKADWEAEQERKRKSAEETDRLSRESDAEEAKRRGVKVKYGSL